MQNPDSSHPASTKTVPKDVKQYETPIKRMESEAAYREWLDRSKLVVPVSEATAEKNNPHVNEPVPCNQSEQDAALSRVLNGQFADDKRFAGMELHATSCDGDVTVVGFVPDRATMAQVAAMVERSEGVRTVINNLRIHDAANGDAHECITQTPRNSQFSSKTSKLLTSALSGAAELLTGKHVFDGNGNRLP